MGWPTSGSGGCQCLYEIENNMPRTKHCFAPCAEQMEILKKRREAGEPILITATNTDDMDVVHREEIPQQGEAQVRDVQEYLQEHGVDEDFDVEKSNIAKDKIIAPTGDPLSKSSYPVGAYIVHKRKGTYHKIIGHSKPDPWTILCKNKQEGYTYNDPDMLRHDVIQAEELLKNGFDVKKDLVSFFDMRHDIKYDKLGEEPPF